MYHSHPRTQEHIDVCSYWICQNPRTHWCLFLLNMPYARLTNVEFGKDPHWKKCTRHALPGAHFGKNLKCVMILLKLI